MLCMLCALVKSLHGSIAIGMVHKAEISPPNGITNLNINRRDEKKRGRKKRYTAHEMKRLKSQTASARKNALQVHHSS